MIDISGSPRPGLISAVTQVLLNYGANILHIEQASLENIFGLSLILDLPKTDVSGDAVVKDLLFETCRLDLKLTFRLLAPGELERNPQRKSYVLTHFGGTEALVELSNILIGEHAHIDKIGCANHHGALSMEMVITLTESSDFSILKQRIMDKSREIGTDIAFQKMETHRKNKRLIVFDMDSTLVDMEIIDEMAKRAGVHREVARVTEKAMRGEFDFEESLVQRVAFLKGLNVEDLASIREGIPLSEGVKDLTSALKFLGYKMGVVTGGFDFFAEHIKEILGFDYVYSNRLEMKNGKLTGRVEGKIIDSAEKARIVNQIACDEGILLDQTVVVGDGANDALMLGQAGLAVAYNAKKGLDRVANVALGKARMAHIFHLLGITEEDVSQAVECKTDR